MLSLVFMCAWAYHVDDAWARVGRGRSSFGSRGSRSAAPPRTYTSPTRPTQPRPGVAPTRPTAPPSSQPSSFWRSFGGGMLGGLAGGLLFGSLFGGRGASAGMGGGGGGGIGLFDILLLAGIGYLIYWYIKKKRQEAAIAQGGYQTSYETVQMPQANYPPVYDTPQPQLEGQQGWDLQQGLSHIQQMDSYFDETRFQDWCMDAFFQIQGSWANRDMTPVKNMLTEEMYRLLQEDAANLKAQGQINRLENIAVRSVDITEAWQESGQDYITVRVYANLLDYNVDDKSGEVVSGSKTEPVKFEEYWTFTRPVGNNPWQLSSIQQAP
ncbi:MAG: Tim44 domain-containing protein [Syntrophales bacterium]|nr:Tim44 domain-containing protein [Syntrophales bacterium]